MQESNGHHAEGIHLCGNLWSWESESTKLKQMATKMEYCNQTEKTLRISTRRDETTPKLHPPTLLNEWKIPEHVVLHSSITKDLVSRERAILVGTDVKDIINDRLLQSVLDITLQQ